MKSENPKILGKFNLRQNIEHIDRTLGSKVRDILEKQTTSLIGVTLLNEKIKRVGNTPQSRIGLLDYFVRFHIKIK